MVVMFSCLGIDLSTTNFLLPTPKGFAGSFLWKKVNSTESAVFFIGKSGSLTILINMVASTRPLEWCPSWNRLKNPVVCCGKSKTWVWQKYGHFDAPTVEKNALDYFLLIPKGNNKGSLKTQHVEEPIPETGGFGKSFKMACLFKRVLHQQRKRSSSLTYLLSQRTMKKMFKVWTAFFTIKCVIPKSLKVGHWLSRHTKSRLHSPKFRKTTIGSAWWKDDNHPMGHPSTKQMSNEEKTVV